MLVKSRLDECGVDNYIPMQRVERSVAGRKQTVSTPLIHNLIFVCQTPDQMRKLKVETTLPICYIMDRAAKCPAVIPDQQMNDFMALVAMQDEVKVEILEPHLIDLKDGMPVRVIDGPFKGIAGKCIKQAGRHRVVVEIGGVAAALTACVPLKYLEKTT